MVNRGVVCAFSAYFLWGVFPVFWKLLHAVPSLEIVAHRILWSAAILAAILAVSGRITSTLSSVRSRRTLISVVAASLFLMTNWLVYIWAVNAGRVVETSLGYFMNPLVNVLLGVIFLRERMRIGQWLAIGVAASGVIWLTVQYGSLPWIGLTLAFSFGFYGLLKKLSKLDAIEGLSAEMGVLLPPMLLLLVYMYAQPGRIDAVAQPATFLLLMLTGVATVGPLLLFGAAARSVPLTVLGLIQYVAPTMQFLLGVLVYREPFSYQLLIGFALIWTALGIYSWEGLAHRRRHGPRPRRLVSPGSSVAT